MPFNLLTEKLKNVNLVRAAFVLVAMVAIIVILSRIIFLWQTKMEHVALQQDVMNLQSSLNFVLVEYILKNKTQDLKHSCINPMEYLKATQKNYLGPISSSSTQNISAGSWYFDQEHCELVYTFLNGNEEKHYAVKVKYVTNQAGKETLESLSIIPVR
jgi:hypothetical protein